MLLCCSLIGCSKKAKVLDPYYDEMYTTNYTSTWEPAKVNWNQIFVCEAVFLTAGFAYAWYLNKSMKRLFAALGTGMTNLIQDAFYDTMNAVGNVVEEVFNDYDPDTPDIVDEVQNIFNMIWNNVDSDSDDDPNKGFEHAR
jgi:hypothetical protein